MLKINNTTMKSPSALKVELFDVGDSSRRNAAGEQVIDRIGVKRRIRAEWSVMSAQEMAALLGAVTAEPFFDVFYPDPLAGAGRTITCSCGERWGGVFRMQGGAPVWKNVSMTWIER